MSEMEIITKAQHEAAVQEFIALATESQVVHRERLLMLRDAIAAYEAAEEPAPPLPKSFESFLELEMFRLKMKQNQFAALLGITQTRLSEILNGKRKPNLDLIKRLHIQLKVPGDRLLELV